MTNILVDVEVGIGVTVGANGTGVKVEVVVGRGVEVKDGVHVGKAWVGDGEGDGVDVMLAAGPLVNSTVI